MIPSSTRFLMYPTYYQGLVLKTASTLSKNMLRSGMSPKSISNMNLASRCMAPNANPANVNTRKNFTSYTKPALSYFDMYNRTHSYENLHNEAQSNSSVASLSNQPVVINNGFGDVAHDDLTVIDNGDAETYSIPDTYFVPEVSTDGEASHNGHSKV